MIPAVPSRRDAEAELGKPHPGIEARREKISPEECL
jgi:hypothetical protein